MCCWSGSIGRADCNVNAVRTAGIEKETRNERKKWMLWVWETGRQWCALTNMKNYFVSREWTPKTREEGNHWRLWGGWVYRGKWGGMEMLMKRKDQDWAALLVRLNVAVKGASIPVTLLLFTNYVLPIRTHHIPHTTHHTPHNTPKYLQVWC